MWIRTKLLTASETDERLLAKDEWEDFVFDTLLIQGYYREKRGTVVVLPAGEYIISESFDSLHETVMVEQNIVERYGCN